MPFSLARRAIELTRLLAFAAGRQGLRFKIIANTIAGILSQPFPEVRELPPNHLCMRTGAGNQLFNNHVNFIMKSGRCWLNFLSRRYYTFSSDVVELGCGCGGIARALKEAWFEGTYVGVDIDEEIIEYCRKNFPAGRFEFILSPHRSKTYCPARDVPRPPPA
jgi:SAM-dependent methyltransferase